MARVLPALGPGNIYGCWGSMPHGQRCLYVSGMPIPSGHVPFYLLCWYLTLLGDSFSPLSRKPRVGRSIWIRLCISPLLAQRLLRDLCPLELSIRLRNEGLLTHTPFYPLCWYLALSRTVTVLCRWQGRAGIHKMKIKIDTGAQGNILLLKVFWRMCPDQLTAESYPKAGSTTGHTILTAYNGTNTQQIISVKITTGYHDQFYGPK